MKITPIYVMDIKFTWDCFECGNFNVHDFADYELEKGKDLVIQCYRCLEKRKVKCPNIVGWRWYPFGDNEHKKKFKKKEKEWFARQNQKKIAYIEELKRESKKRKKKHD